MNGWKYSITTDKFSIWARTCKGKVENFKDRGFHDVALVELYYFSGEAQKCSDTVEIYLMSPTLISCMWGRGMNWRILYWNKWLWYFLYSIKNSNGRTDRNSRKNTWTGRAIFIDEYSRWLITVNIWQENLFHSGISSPAFWIAVSCLEMVCYLLESIRQGHWWAGWFR